MERSSVLIQDRNSVIFQDSMDGIRTLSSGKKKLYLNHVQFNSIEDGRKFQSQGMKNYGLEWVLETFKKKNCTHYIHNPNSKRENTCYCGRQKCDHQHARVKFDHPEKLYWNYKNHCCQSKTNAYGEIVFQGTGKKTRAKYIRISDETSASNIVKLFRKVWMMEYPQLLISVTGGAKAFKLNPKLKVHFTEGLLKVVQTTCTWVVTGGTNTGVMKHVGEALQGATTNVYCIGIATWGIVNDRKRLKNLENDSAATVDYHVSNSLTTRGACLDNNHSHFLLVDKGSIEQYGHEIGLRGKVEQAVCCMKIEKNRDRVPGVQLVLEGGPNTIETVLTAVNSEPPMPVVVIKGSGRAADLIAAAHQLTRGEGPIFEMQEVVERKNLLQMIEKVFSGMSNKKHQDIFKNLLKCVEKKEYITIFKMEEGANIDEAILTAFMKGKNISPFEQLDLAMLWNRVDIARNNIFCDDGNWTIEELHTSMYNALRRNKPEFVQLLLENGVVMRYFLTTTKLEDLYQYRLREENSVSRRLFNLVMNKSSGSAKMHHVDLVLKKLCKGINIRSDEYRHHTIANEIVMIREKPDIRDPVNELFIWAVLCNLKSMTMMLWKHGDESMAKALVGRRLFMAIRDIAMKFQKQDDIIQELESQAEKFGQLAIDLLNEAFQLNEKTAGDLVTCNLVNWGNQTCLSLGVLSHLLGFVAHPCVQSLLNEKWTDALQFTGSPFKQVLVGLLCPLYVMRLNFKSLKEYKLILLTETEFKQVEDEEQTREQEIEQIKTETRRKQSKNSLKSAQIVHEDSLELVSFDSPNRSFEMTSNERVIEETFEMPWYMKYPKFFQAPVTKFVANFIAYLFFLGLFMFVVTTELNKEPYTTEWILVIMVASYTMEEIRQIAESDAQTFRHKIQMWSVSYWNLCDALAILLFFTALVLRLHGRETLLLGHVLYAVDIIFWILRILDMFGVNKHIGPYVVMIGKMTIDLVNFLFVLVVFTLAYGVSRYAILNPYTKRSWSTLYKLVMIPYFQIYGELFLEYPQEDPNKTIFETPTHNHEYIQVVAAIIMAIYLLVANVLLINLLIAIFNNTYTQVQANSNEIWKFQRYRLIQEYSARSAFFPPLSIIVHVYLFFRWLFNRSFSSAARGKHADRRLKKFLNKDDLHDVILFEEKCLASYLRRQNSIYSASNEEKLRIINDRLDGVSKVAERYIIDSTTTNQGNSTHLNNLKERMDNLEEIMRTMMVKLTDVHSTLHYGNAPSTMHHSNVSRRPSSQPPNQQNNYHRSISEFHTLGGGGAAFHPPTAPCSLPVGVNGDRRSSATSLNLPSTPTGGTYPNRRADRSSFVRRAAHNFKRPSLKARPSASRAASNQRQDSPSKKGSFSRAISMDESASFEKRSSTRRRTLSDVNRPEVKINDHVQILSPIISEIRPRDFEASNPMISKGDPSERQRQGSHPTLQRTQEVVEDDENDDIIYTGDEGFFVEGYEEYNDEDLMIPEEIPNILSRCPSYPFSDVQREFVPDIKVPWNIPMDDYSPPSYTSPTVSSYLPWVDPDPQSDKFRKIGFNMSERKSCCGTYELNGDGVPRNPVGRTGLEGRGLLCHYGPNHLQFALITRWKKNMDGMGYPSQLELLVIVQKNSKLSLPNGPEVLNNSMSPELLRFFSKTTLISKGVDISTCDSVWIGLNKIIDKREKIWEGYMDDRRNTDHAWIEATVFNYHDPDGNIISQFISEPPSDEEAAKSSKKMYQWKDVCIDPRLLVDGHCYGEATVMEWLDILIQNKEPSLR
ncbi:transient receptor potential cation channel subfamily M member-like 2 isoform X2 [Clytia hemisphaerica]